MPEVNISGPEGRLESRYMPAADTSAPLALILHPEPDRGGNMNNRVSLAMYKLFQDKGFHVMRFNFRGVGRSEGVYDKGEGELSDAAMALDWIEAQCAGTRACWIAGFSFGAWIAMQLMMRRPEVSGFVAITPPASDKDFSFLAPCPSSGLILHGGADTVVPAEDVADLAQRIQTQRGIEVELRLISDANHFFTSHLDELMAELGSYIDKAMPGLERPQTM